MKKVLIFLCIAMLLAACGENKSNNSYSSGIDPASVDSVAGDTFVLERDRLGPLANGMPVDAVPGSVEGLYDSYKKGYYKNDDYLQFNKDGVKVFLAYYKKDTISCIAILKGSSNYIKTAEGYSTHTSARKVFRDMSGEWFYDDDNHSACITCDGYTYCVFKKDIKEDEGEFIPTTASDIDKDAEIGYIINDASSKAHYIDPDTTVLSKVGKFFRILLTKPTTSTKAIIDLMPTCERGKHGPVLLVLIMAVVCLFLYKRGLENGEVFLDEKAKDRFIWKKVLRIACMAVLCLLVLKTVTAEAWEGNIEGGYWFISAAGGFIRQSLADLVFLGITILVFVGSAVALLELCDIGQILYWHWLGWILILISPFLPFVTIFITNPHDYEDLTIGIIYYANLAIILIAFISSIKRKGNILYFIFYIPLYILFWFASVDIVGNYIAEWVMGKVPILNVLTIINDGFF